MQVFGGLKNCRCLAKPRGRLAESLDILRSLGADTYPSSNILLRVRDTLESNPEFRRELVQYGEFETCPDWVPAMDSCQQFARITLKTMSAHGFDHGPVQAAKVRNVSRLGRQINFAI